MHLHIQSKTSESFEINMTNMCLSISCDTKYVLHKIYYTQYTDRKCVSNKKCKLLANSKIVLLLQIN